MTTASQGQIDLQDASRDLKGGAASNNSLGSTDGRAMVSMRQRLSNEAVGDTVANLNAVEGGDAKVADELLKLVYDELRRLAAFKMAQQAPGQTLQATALVHEAWLKLVGAENPTFKNRTHFFSAAAEAMRHILIDRARRKQTQRHGGRFERVELDEFEICAPSPDDQMLAVHESLEKFARDYPIQAEVVKLRYFAGMTNEEVAQLLSISVRSVNNYWDFARAWLFEEIEGK
jgi:RNA polymerase sigma factor (TIGR02999 family)